MLATPGKRDAERTGCVNRILEKQFVEIAHAIEEQRTGIVCLDLDELLHHRGGRGTAFLRGELVGGQGVDGQTFKLGHWADFHCAWKVATLSVKPL
ncbi:hypothetical protein D3C73_1440280 [compost metagenome]